MLPKPAPIPDTDIQISGKYEFVHCPCGSIFRTLLVRGIRFVEITRAHTCVECKQLAQYWAERTGQHLLLEV